MKFYLGIHKAAWIERTSSPVLISMSGLWQRRKLFESCGSVAIDSGGFSQLRLNGQWTKSPGEYLTKLKALEALGLRYEWAAPQDWMVEPNMLERTGLSLEEHQHRTVENFVILKKFNSRIIPVLQGQTIDQYFDCFELYEAAGIDLRSEPLVGVGSVCRRQGTDDIEHIMRSLYNKDLKLHGFGVKTLGLERYADCLSSVDSLAWSITARYDHNICSHHQTHPHPISNIIQDCRNCLLWAEEWRQNILRTLDSEQSPRINFGSVNHE